MRYPRVRTARGSAGGLGSTEYTENTEKGRGSLRITRIETDAGTRPLQTSVTIRVIRRPTFQAFFCEMFGENPVVPSRPFVNILALLL
jgi:hypothetical protein